MNLTVFVPMTVFTAAPFGRITGPKKAAIYSCRSCVGGPWRSVAVVTLLVLVLSTSGV